MASTIATPAGLAMEPGARARFPAAPGLEQTTSLGLFTIQVDPSSPEVASPGRAGAPASVAAEPPSADRGRATSPARD